MVYNAGITSIDYENGKIIYANQLDLSPIMVYRKKMFDQEQDFNAMPKNLVINDDGSTTILLEQQSTLEQTVRKSTWITYTRGDIGILDVDASGRSIRGYLIPKHQEYSQNASRPIDDFFSYSFVSAPVVCCVFFNNNEKNFTANNEGNNPLILRTIEAGQSAVCQFKGDNVDKAYLFGSPQDEQDRNFAFFGSADYNSANHRYAMLMVAKVGFEKNAHIAWIQF